MVATAEPSRAARAFEVGTKLLGRPWVGTLLLVSAVAVYLWPLVSPVLTPPKFDEFVVVYDSQRVALGQVPYRDFFNFIPPGTFYLLGLLFALAGKGSLTLARYLSLATALAGWLALYGALLRSGWSRGKAALFSLLYPLVLYPFWAVPSHHWTALMCCMIFLWVAAGSRPEGPGSGRLAILGCMTGLAGLFLQNEGVYLAACGIVLALAWGPAKLAWRRALAFTAPVGAVLLAAILPLLALGAGSNLVRDLFIWPARNYSRSANENAQRILGDLPHRLSLVWSDLAGSGQFSGTLFAVTGIAFYALFLAAALGLVLLACWGLWTMFRQRTIRSPFLAAATLVTFLGLGLYARGRPDWLHLVYLTSLLWGVWLVCLGQTREFAPGIRRALTITAAALLLLGGTYQARRVLTHVPQGWELRDADRLVRGYVTNRFLAAPGALAPGDTVAAFPEGGEVYLYSGHPAVGYTLFFPIGQEYNDLHDHRMVADQIVRNRCRWVLMPPDMEGAYLDTRSPVGQLLRTRFERKGQIGMAVVYERVGG